MNLQILKKLWDEYKAGIVVAVGIAVILLGGMAIIKNLRSEPLVAGISVNVEISDEGKTYLMETFRESVNSESSGKALLADTKLGLLEDNDEYEDNYYALQALEALHRQKEIDYMILDETALKTLSPRQLFLDLRQVFSEEALAQLKENELVIFAQYNDEEALVPLFLEITNTDFCKAHCQSSDRIFIAVASTSTRTDIFPSLFAHLQAWKSA